MYKPLQVLSMYQPLKLLQRASTDRRAHQRLLHQHAEENGVSDFPEALEDLSAQVGVLDQVVQLGLEVHQHTCAKPHCVLILKRDNIITLLHQHQTSLGTS